MSLKLITDYKHNDQYRHSFNQLAHMVFGIDFEQWYQKGFWDDSYTCYSYADGQRIVANVSASRLDAVVGGQDHRTIQIGTVMTHPKYRGQGLAKDLISHVKERYETECDFVFLFAAPEVQDFYPRFGFQALTESRFSLDISDRNPSPGRLRKLNPDNSGDLRLISEAVANRPPVSQILGIKNSRSIFMWYCFNVFKDHFYYMPDKDALIVYRQEGDTVHLFDIVTRRSQVRFENLVPYLLTDKAREIVFYFTPDLLNIEASCSPGDPNDKLFISKVPPMLAENFKYPITSQA